ncbi:Predicted small integral membrane protein [Thalassococcus halodurans]|jgi:predicted small integral membrane protein|uniref:Predicted small integral membrane protein n=2 Tax=Roseobacteraceae TaxID=2854170 RepID=A0A1H5WPP3_9RHOB|nr:Predicted small integral membrane protein [Thalassococcus halodurans]
MMKRLLLLTPLFIATTSHAQGWGNVAQKEVEKGFSWTDPLWPSFWMAWTPATFALFCGIFGAIAVIGLLEGFKYRDGIERKGILGLTTTLGDRLFISLLGSAYIFLAWLGFIGQPLWWPLGLSIAWGIFCFRKV